MGVSGCRSIQRMTPVEISFAIFAAMCTVFGLAWLIRPDPEVMDRLTLIALSCGFLVFMAVVIYQAGIGAGINGVLRECMFAKEGEVAACIGAQGEALSVIPSFGGLFLVLLSFVLPPMLVMFLVLVPDKKRRANKHDDGEKMD